MGCPCSDRIQFYCHLLKHIPMAIQRTTQTQGKSKIQYVYPPVCHWQSRRRPSYCTSSRGWYWFLQPSTQKFASHAWKLPAIYTFNPTPVLHLPSACIYYTCHALYWKDGAPTRLCNRRLRLIDYRRSCSWFYAPLVHNLHFTWLPDCDLRKYGHLIEN